MRICELREKEVINICNCKRLGCVVDIEMNICDGCVEAIIIPGPGKICGFLGTDSEYVIPFSCIKKIEMCIRDSHKLLLPVPALHTFHLS